MESTVINMDCMDYMRSLPDKAFQLAIVDPPYGRNGTLNGGGRSWKYRTGDETFCDQTNVAPTSEYWKELFRVSVNQIVWGGNYFPLGPCDCFAVWDKQQPDNLSFCSVEMAWTSFQKRTPVIFRKRPFGRPGERFHPTQKPVELYKFLLERFAKQGDRILDTHGGSFSSAIACYDLGFDLDICEINPVYYVPAKERLEKHIAEDKAQLRLPFE